MTPDQFAKGATDEGESFGPVIRKLSELERPPEDDPNELLKRRFLCRGGGLLLVGPTGIGKSTLTMQMILQWAVGRPAFGIAPKQALRSVLIQAENDDGDLTEMRDGIASGLGFTEEEKKMAFENINVCTECGQSGPDFFEKTVSPAIEQCHPDLVIIDPALAYLGGESNNQRDVGLFLRNSLNPLIKMHNVGVIIVHHTNKPPSGKEKGSWSNEENAYLGSGSAEWANWARAVIALRSTGKKDIFGASVFELCVPKRGRRVGWRQPDGEAPAFTKMVRHSRADRGICWDEMDEEEIADFQSEKCTEEDLLEAVPPGQTIEKSALIAMKIKGVGQNKAREMVNELISEGRLIVVPMKRKGARNAVYLERPPMKKAA